MGKTWVLETETKGTGAHVVPLEKGRKDQVPERDLAIVRLARPPHPERVPEPLRPLEFKVVDVMGGRVLAEGVSALAALERLEQLRSVLDARVYVRTPKSERWRLLTLDEQKTLWRFRREQAARVAG